MIELPALKNGRRALAGGMLLAAVAAVASITAIAAPAASAAPVAPAASTAPAAPATSNPPGQIVFSAVGATPHGANGRYEFIYNNIKPGSTIKDWVELYNRSAQTAGFEVYTVDATGTTLGGSLTYDQANQKPKDIGTWGSFYNSKTQPNATQASFVMGGGSGIIEPFTITVPSFAAPGDHTGGLVVQVAVPTVNSHNQRVTIYSRIALPVLLRVTGPLKESVQVQSISTGFSTSVNPFGASSASISYSVVNTGNVRISGAQLLKVSGIFGARSVTPPHLPTILPGDSVRVTTAVGGLYPAGPYTATVTVTPNWPKSSPSTSLSLAVVTDSASFFALPWALIVLILLLVGLGFGGWRLLRWRVRQRAADMAAVAAAARKDAERSMAGKAAATASTANASGSTTTTGTTTATGTITTTTGIATTTADDAAPGGPGEGE